MERALLTHDWSIAFVANNSSRHTPFPYNVATLWSALEGSIILWATVLAGYMVVTAGEVPSPAAHPLRGGGPPAVVPGSLFFFWVLFPNVGPADVFHGLVFLLGIDAPERRPARPVCGDRVCGPPGFRRSRSHRVVADPHPHGVPPASAVPRLCRVHRAVRVRDRRAGDRPA